MPIDSNVYESVAILVCRCLRQNLLWGHLNLVFWILEINSLLKLTSFIQIWVFVFPKPQHRCLSGSPLYQIFFGFALLKMQLLNCSSEKVNRATSEHAFKCACMMALLISAHHFKTRQSSHFSRLLTTLDYCRMGNELTLTSTYRCMFNLYCISCMSLWGLVKNHQATEPKICLILPYFIVLIFSQISHLFIENFWYGL